MIEEASPGDAGEVLSVINTSNREAYKSVIPQEYFREPVLLLEELLHDWERMTFYVYRSEGRVVGVAALQVESEETGRVRWVYILPEFQRRGIGTALVRRVEAEARALGLYTLRVLTFGKAHWAVRFYERLGYVVNVRIEGSWGFDLVLEKSL